MDHVTYILFTTEIRMDEYHPWSHHLNEYWHINQSFGPSDTNFYEIRIKYDNFHLKKLLSKMFILFKRQCV